MQVYATGYEVGTRYVLLKYHLFLRIQEAQSSEEVNLQCTLYSRYFGNISIMSYTFHKRNYLLSLRLQNVIVNTITIIYTSVVVPTIAVPSFIYHKYTYIYIRTAVSRGEDDEISTLAKTFFKSKAFRCQVQRVMYRNLSTSVQVYYVYTKRLDICARVTSNLAYAGYIPFKRPSAYRFKNIPGCVV